MNPNEIRKAVEEKMLKNDKNEKKEEEKPQKTTFFFKLGVFVGAIIHLVIVFFMWNEVAPIFGLPELSFIHFFMILFVLKSLVMLLRR